MLYKLFDIITIGIPFGVFKITSGLFYETDLLLYWGLLDIAINSFNFIMYIFTKKKFLPTCLLALLGQQIGKKTNIDSTLTEDTGESFDVLFSFCIVAIVIGSGDIARYTSEMTLFWNISVVLNVLGAGSIRVLQSIKRYQE